MKQFISFLFTLFFIIQSPKCQSKKYKIRTIAFYNVENLFDTIDQPDLLDDEFTPKGRNRYTSEVYLHKIKNTARVISEIGKDRSGSSPVIIGLVEIENSSVLEDLIHTPLLENSHYRYIHFDSPDLRGIDVALLYKETFFKPLQQDKVEVKLWDESDKRIYTRDILWVKGFLDDEMVYILVNHWPSRRGGQVRSSPKREKAAYILNTLIGQIREEEPDAKIIVMGDFNDDPVDKSIKTGLNATGKRTKLHPNSLYNPMENMYQNGLNTLGYRDHINLFDQIMLSFPLISFNKVYDTYKLFMAGVFNPDYLITQEGRFKGYPFRSYANGHYSGGYSDHFPVYIYLIREENNP